LLHLANYLSELYHNRWSKGNKRILLFLSTASLQGGNYHDFRHSGSYPGQCPESCRHGAVARLARRFSSHLLWVVDFHFLFRIYRGAQWDNQLPPAPSSPIAGKEHSAEPTIAPRGADVTHTKHLIAGLILLLALGSLTLKTIHFDAAPVPLRQSFDNFPLELGPWQGKQSYIDPAVLEVLKADNYLDIEYVNPQPESASLWIAHYTAQKPGASFHSPTICITGWGWGVLLPRLLPDNNPN
jgi:hypothetical protein